MPQLRTIILLAILLMATALNPAGHSARAQVGAERNLLYVACPGIRDYLEYGGHGLLVFDMDDNHRFVRRIPLGGLDASGVPINVKGICGNSRTGKIYVSTIKTLMCVDMMTDALLWERAYEGGCDRMSMTPDGKFIYQPSFEREHWHVLDAQTGEVIAKLVPNSAAHNTVIGLDGKFAYLAGLKSPLLTIVDISSHSMARTTGPFSASIRPFTVNASQTRCYVCINELLGFEVGDLVSGEKLFHLEVSGFAKGEVKRHGCPSHGIGLTPDEKEIWVVDAHNRQVHIFNNAAEPPKQVASIALRDEPGWITFSLDGKWAYPSTGEIVDTQTRRVTGQLIDEHGAMVQSEKMLQVVFQGKPIRNGDQFGVGRKP